MVLCPYFVSQKKKYIVPTETHAHTRWQSGICLIKNVACKPGVSERHDGSFAVNSHMQLFLVNADKHTHIYKGTVCLHTHTHTHTAPRARGRQLFNSFSIAAISSPRSITLSAGIYSSLVLIMKMWSGKPPAILGLWTSAVSWFRDGGKRVRPPSPPAGPQRWSHSVVFLSPL